MNARIVATLVVCTIAACRDAQETTQLRRSPAASATMSGAAASAATTKGFETKTIVLYQPDPILRERVPSVEVLSSYIKAVQGACQAHFATASAPEVVDVVVAIKPGRRARAWFVSPSRVEDDESLSRLRQQIESVTPPEIRSGPVAFAIVAAIAGAPREQSGPPGFRAPMPKAWRDAPLGDPTKVLVPDDVLRVIWPDP